MNISRCGLVGSGWLSPPHMSRSLRWLWPSSIIIFGAVMGYSVYIHTVIPYKSPQVLQNSVLNFEDVTFSINIQYWIIQYRIFSFKVTNFQLQNAMMNFEELVDCRRLYHYRFSLHTFFRKEERITFAAARIATVQPHSRYVISGFDLEWGWPGILVIGGSVVRAYFPKMEIY
jgi:hypothetical protein